jgi:lysophospholipase L1-like esterase
VVPAPDYNNQASFLGYPEHLARDLHLKLANAACPGETSASLINFRAQSNTCENALGGAGHYRFTHPLHVKYNGSQLAYGVSYLRRHHDVRLVSLMIGANDFFLCEKTTSDGCLTAKSQQPLWAKIGRNVHTILSAIRGRAHYRGQIVVVNYYSSDYSSAFVSGILHSIDLAQDRAARPFGVKIADGFGEFKAAAAHSGGNSCTAGLLTQLGSADHCGIHPSYAGQALLAASVLKVIRL